MTLFTRLLSHLMQAEQQRQNMQKMIQPIVRYVECGTTLTTFGNVSLSGRQTEEDD